MQTFSAKYKLIKRVGLVGAGLVAALFGPIASAQTQGISVPFASTFAGLTTGSNPTAAVCTNGLPIYTSTGTGANYGDGCLPTQASLNTPIGVVMDRFGNLFIADQSHNLIRVVYNSGATLAAAIIAANPHLTNLTPVKGNIYTIAGGYQKVATTPFYCNGASGATGANSTLDNCPGAQTYSQPRGLGVDNDGNLFYGDISSPTSVRMLYVGGAAAATLLTKLNPSITPQPGYVYRVAGSTATYAGDGGLATSAGVNTPRSIVVDANENVYFADNLNGVVRRIDGSTGNISTVAGHCVDAGKGLCTATASSGDGGVATDNTVNIYQPYSVAFDSLGNLYIAEGGSTSVSGRVRVVYAAGTLAGISNPIAGHIYTLAGGASTTGTAAQRMTFQFIYGVSVDAAGYVYATEYRSGSTAGNKIYRIDTSSGAITPIAGTGSTALANGNHCDRVNQVGLSSTDNFGDNCPATQAYLNLPQGPLVFDGSGNGYIADRGNNVVRKLAYNNLFPATAVGQTSAALPQAFYFATPPVLLTKTPALAGQATTEFIVTTGQDNCAVGYIVTSTPVTCVNYVAFTPTQANTRRGSYTLADATGAVAVEPLTGVGLNPVLTLDPATAGTLGAGLQPQDVNTDQQGAVYISDTKNGQVVRGSISGGAGTSVITGLTSPQQAAVDGLGNLFVADSGTSSVVEVSAAGAKITLGTGLKSAEGLAVDRFGNLYIADTGNSRLLYLNMSNGVQSTVSVPGITWKAPSRIAIDTTGNVFVVDRDAKSIVELPVNAAPAILTLPSGIAPLALAADSAGTLYIADATNKSIVTLPAGLAVTSTLVSGFGSLKGVALDAAGNLFVADANATSVTAYNRNAGTATFSTTNFGQSSLPIAVNLSNVGNASATLATPALTETGTAAAFPLSGTPACADAQTLSGGASCADTFVFTPTAAGNQTARATFSTSLGASLTETLTGFATNLIATTTTVAISPAGSTLQYGNTGATFSSTLTLSRTGTANPTGTVTFSLDGVAQAPQTVSGAGPYIFTYKTAALTVGTHIISVQYSGDAQYGTSSAQTSVTVSGLQSQTTLSAVYGQAGNNQYTFTANVVQAVSTNQAPTGTVTFTIDGVSSGSVQLTNGVATFTRQLADGTHTYSVTYNGDTAYSATTTGPQFITFNHIASTLTSTAAQTSAGLNTTAILTPASAGPVAATGTITFTIDGKAQTAKAIANNQASLTTYPVPDGTHVVSAVYSGDTYYAASTSAQVSTVTARVASATTLTLTPSSGTGLANGSTVSNLTLTALVTPAAGSGPEPTGSVIFTNTSGQTVTSTLNTSGVATATFSQSTLTSLTFTAQYIGLGSVSGTTVTNGGDGIYLPSASSAVTVATDFYVTDPVINLTVPQGTQALANIVLASYGGYTGTITASCSGLPANSLCRFVPSSVSLSSTTQSAILPVQIFVSINPNTASVSARQRSSVVFAALLLSPLALFGFARRKRTVIVAACGLLLLCTGSLLTGCGSSTVPKYVTPTGVTPVTVTLTDTVTGATKTATINLTVSAN